MRRSRGRDRWAQPAFTGGERTRTNRTNEALEALDAESLRAILREHIANLEDPGRAGLESALVEAAARSGATPTRGLTDERVEEILRAVGPGGYIEAETYDGWLGEGNAAALRGQDEVARRLLGGLLRALSSADVYLGQHELVDEVLGIDIGTVAARYVNCVYRTTPMDERVEAVMSALDDVDGLMLTFQPLRAMEQAAVAPLPDFDAFVILWRDHLRTLVTEEFEPQFVPWEREESSQLREAIERAGGTEHLAAHARATRRRTDLAAWCKRTREAGDWAEILAVHDEAAALFGGERHHVAEFLDEAALAAQVLERRDLPARLEAAWQAHPTLRRLRRWLSTAATARTLRTRARKALAAVPEANATQRAFLHLLLDENAEAAALVAAAPGLGWSNPEHPGHLAFPVLVERFAQEPRPARAPADGVTEFLETWIPHDAVHLGAPRPEEPTLAAESVEELLVRANPSARQIASQRAAVRASLRKAAERRVQGVTKEGRTRHYGHAASLVADCVACGPKETTTVRWCAALRECTKRYRKLRAELSAILGPDS